MSVLADENLNYYAVFDTEYQQNRYIAAIPKRAYWFSDQRVRAGDRVYLYTKAGTENRKTRPDRNVSHFYYWGLKKPLWAGPPNCAILLAINDWENPR